jgi:sugar-phosphatase
MTMTAVRAALFDLDGTLVDSEVHTDTAIRVIAGRHGVSGFTLPHTETRGRTWAHIADVMRARTGIPADPSALVDELLACWSDIAADVTPIPGAPEAIREAATRLPLGVVSSSPRSVIDAFLGKLGIEDCVDARARIGGDMVRASKPDPDGFLQGARALGIAPADCLAFEDSRAGLEAARAAGMRSMFIMCCAADIPGNTALATAACTDYRHLPPRFWRDIADGGLDIAGRVYA